MELQRRSRLLTSASFGNAQLDDHGIRIGHPGRDRGTELPVLRAERTQILHEVREITVIHYLKTGRVVFLHIVISLVWCRSSPRLRRCSCPSTTTTARRRNRWWTCYRKAYRYCCRTKMPTGRLETTRTCRVIGK